ncbi:MAG TPA: hypothetical protein VME18_00745 [Acidobacteriaceae bacterium]|nr:hypothetical protein [Acidobacteriaceae bacterium]
MLLRVTRTLRSWCDFENGATLGSQGSESGFILLDEEYLHAARITLERATRVAPFAITCGVYGRLLHTRYFGPQARALSEYAAMKNVLQEIVDGFDSDAPRMRTRAQQALEEFTEKFPA